MGQEIHYRPRLANLGSSAAVPNIIVGSGELARRVREHDWSSTALGPIETWPSELTTMVNLTLCSPTPTRLLWSAEFILIYNDAYRDLAGSRHPEALGLPARHVWSEAWHVVGPQIKAVYNTGATSYFERSPVPISRNGTLQNSYLTYSYSPVYQQGEIAGVFGSLLDVTAEVETAAQLSESEARASRILESIGDAVIVTDAKTQIIRMNAVAELLTGWVREEANGRPLAEVFNIVSEETGVVVESSAQEVKRHGKIVSLANQTILKSKRGRQTYIDESGAPIRNDRGDLTGIVLVFRDISDRRTAEQERERLQRELLRQYTEMKAIYETSSVALAMIDPVDLRYVRGNPKLAEILHAPIEQILGSPVFDLAHDVAGLRDALLTAASGTPVLGKVIEGTLVNTPGIRRSWQVEYIPVFSEQGAVEMIVASSIEITEQRQAQTALMQNEKLAAVGRLAASIAHEINNPLEAVMNCIYLARTELNVSRETQELLDTAERELRRVSAITSQTLRFHKQSTKAVPISCEALIDGGLSIYQGRILNAGILVEQRTRACRAVTCFDGEIRQVLNNLVSNAIDAMHSSGGRLMLRSREATNWKTGARGLVLTVADTGPGMTQETLKRVFEPFFTTKGAGGTGLGLWISCEIVNRHGGSLRVRSGQHPGASGTVLALFLPFETVIR